MKKQITLKYSAECRECGSYLPAGSRANYYNKNHIYGLSCHSGELKEKDGNLVDSKGNIGWVITTASGAEVFQNYKGRCIDAPCCGCCS
jgi:hypothetical protein